MATAAVVIPVYATPENHRLDLLAHTIRSVELQTHPGVVPIVVDDGSLVNVESSMRECGFTGARYVRRTRSPSDLKTASNALNLGIDLCLARSGDVFSREEASTLAAVGYLHSDDLLPPWSVKKRLAALTLSDAFVYADLMYIDSSNRSIGVRRWAGKLGWDMLDCFPHHTVLWPVDFAQQLKDYTNRHYGQKGIFDARLTHGEDRDVTASSVELALLNGETIRHVPSVAYLYRCHTLSITGDNVPVRYADSQRRLIDEKHFGTTRNALSRYGRLFNHLTSDLPWSLGYSLPEPVKRPLRPVMHAVRKVHAVTAISAAEKQNLEYLVKALAP